MSIFKKRFLPDQVFTPRSPQVNPDMYIDRPNLERSLTKAVGGSKNVIVSGESGSGKTWLYKQVFDVEKVTYETVNLANASLKGGLEAAFQDKIDRLGGELAVERTKTGSARVAPANIGAEIGSTIRKKIGQRSSFESLLSLLRDRAKSGRAILVYDNLEQILRDENLIRAVSNTLILLDDDDLSSYKVKICVVGVPTDIRQYLIKASRNLTTIANRIIEIPEVARLSASEAVALMKRGFEEKLRYRFQADASAFYKNACWKTDRIAQHIHEYCLSIAHHAEANNDVIDDAMVIKAEQEWLTQTLSADYAAIEAKMNARETKEGGRNQILYSIGMCDDESFKYTDVEEIVRKEFVKSTRSVGLNIAGNLSELSSGDKPLIRRTLKGDAYRFTSPKYRMCLRTMLRKTSDERVEKIPQVDMI